MIKSALFLLLVLIGYRDASSALTTIKPTAYPTVKSTFKPTAFPTVKPTRSPTTFPTFNPTAEPTTATPSAIPTPKPSPSPTPRPTLSTEPIKMEHTEKAYIIAYISVVYTFLFVVSALVVKNFAEPGFPKLTYVSLTIGYFASFGILFLVPIDIANAVVSRRTMQITGLQYFPNTELLQTMYSILFNTILFLGSLWLCIEEYYHTDGYFNPFYRLLSSIYRFLRDTIAGIIMGIIILIILIVKKVVSSDAGVLQLTAVICTNIIYESFLMFLLGYGLIEFPRLFWSCSNLDYYLKQTEMKASSAFKAVTDCKLEISLQCSNVIKTKEELSAYGSQQLNDAMAILFEEMPKNQYGQLEFKSGKMGEVATNKSGQITIDSLADLRYKLKIAKDAYKMAQIISEETNILAYNLMDIINARDGKYIDKDGIERETEEKSIKWSIRGTDSTIREYNWYVKYRPIYWRFCALGAACLSILSFVGVCCSMYGVDPQKSPYFLAVHQDSSSVGAIVIFIFITFGYTIYVVIWALFQMRFAGLMNLVPGQTTPECLSFNVRMVARLAAPLAFFYLGWIAESGLNDGPWTWNRAPDYYYSYMYYNTTASSYNSSNSFVPIIYGNNTSSNSTGTDDGIIIIDSYPQKIFMPSAFSNFYQLQSIGVIKTTFGTIFPVILFIVVSLIAPNVLNRLLVLAKMEKFQFGTEIISEEDLKLGVDQLNRFKKLTTSNYRKKGFRNMLSVVGGSHDGAGGLWGCLMGAKSKTNDDDGKTTRRLSTVMVKAPPAELSCLIEKKGAGGGFSFGPAWQKQWCRIINSKMLAFYRRDTDPATSDPGAVPDKQYDITLIVSIVVFDKEVKDELHIEFMDETVRVRLKTQDEAAKFKEHVLEWKEFAIEHQDFSSGSGQQDADVEAGVPLKVPETLDDIIIEGESEMDLKNLRVSSNVIPEKPKSQGFSGFSFGKKPAAGSGSSIEMSEKKHLINKKPDSMEGWVEKKIETHWQNTFHKRYLKLDESSGMLLVMKDINNKDDKSTAKIDIRLVSNVRTYNKEGKADPKRFTIDLDDQIHYKLKAPTDAECQKWVKCINDWKEYLLLEMH